MFLVAQVLKAQTYPEWSAEQLDKANTAKNTGLSQEEQLVFFFCNLARLDGGKFMHTYAVKYLSGSTSELISLRKELPQIKNRPMLYPDKNLCYTAALHAEDMGTHGTVGHNSSDGTGCFDRIFKYYDCYNAAENCSYGYSEALDIVMQLLIDAHTPSLGHRKNILNEKYNAMGVSIRPHKGFGYNCVQDFGAKLLTPMPTVGNNNNNTSSDKSRNTDVHEHNLDIPKNNSPTPPKNDFNSSNEIENALNYLNAVRKNPSLYSKEVGVDLGGVKPMPQLKWNFTLAKAAQAKALDMVERNYFAHVDPDGSGMNYKINAAGYQLRADWLSDYGSNFFESLAAGTATGKETIIMLLNDDGASDEKAGHRRHLLAIDDFYSNCYDIGIGMAKGGKYGYYWCVLIAKHDF